MDPSDVQLAAWNAWALLWNNDISKAKKWFNKAIAIDSNNGEALHLGSLIATKMENHKEAIRLAKKAASNDPNWRVGIPLALAKSGQKEQAMTCVQKIASTLNAFDAMLLIEVYAHLGDDDKALDYFEKSFELRHPFMPWLEFIPDTDHLHSNPRYKNLIKKMNLPK